MKVETENEVLEKIITIERGEKATPFQVKIVDVRIMSYLVCLSS